MKDYLSNKDGVSLSVNRDKSKMKLAYKNIDGKNRALFIPFTDLDKLLDYFFDNRDVKIAMAQKIAEEDPKTWTILRDDFPNVILSKVRSKFRACGYKMERYSTQYFRMILTTLG